MSINRNESSPRPQGLKANLGMRNDFIHQETKSLKRSKRGVDKIWIGPDHRLDHGLDHGPDHGSDHRSDHGSDHGSDHVSDQGKKFKIQNFVEQITLE